MSKVSRRLAAKAAAFAVVLVVGLLAGGCGGCGPACSAGPSGQPTGMPIGTIAPDFALPDVNPASGTFGTAVSPSQVGGSASAWYFGHST